MVNFDNGAVPALLADIRPSSRSRRLRRFDRRAAVRRPHGMSPVSGMILQSKWKQYVIGTAVILNALSIFLLPLAPSDATWLILLSRLCVGISQATYLIFAPVWVDEFSPDNKKSLWLSLCQAGIPLGIMVGYGVSGALRNENLSWKIPFYLQGGLLLPFGVALFLIPTAYLDVDAQK